MKSMTLMALLLLTSAFASANSGGSIELSEKQSLEMAVLLESSGVQPVPLERGEAIFRASDVSCTLERMTGVSCTWTITKGHAKKTITQELPQKKADQLYDLLHSAGANEELDGRTSQFHASEIICMTERMNVMGCSINE